MKHAHYIIAVAFFTLTTNTAFAACTYSSIQGKWSVAYAHFNSEIGFSTYGIGRITIDAATKKLSLLGGKESSFGIVGSGTGSGTYTINAACQGVMNLTFGAGGPTVKFDFVVSGTTENPSINFILAEPTNQLSGSGFMQKIGL